MERKSRQQPFFILGEGGQEKEGGKMYSIVARVVQRDQSVFNIMLTDLFTLKAEKIEPVEGEKNQSCFTEL